MTTKADPALETMKSWKPGAVFCTLACLKTGPKHGYEIAEHIRSRSGGLFDYSFGTLYPALHKLEKSGLVESRWELAEQTKPRRVYHLTSKGLSFLEETLSSQQSSLNAIQRLIGVAE